MKFEQIKNEYAEEFRRLTGIKRRTFEVILMILREAETVLKSQGGNPNKLALEDR